MTGPDAATTRPLERVRPSTQPATLGAYRLYERLGAGGQACVYRARRLDDPDAGDVALKRLHPHLTDEPVAIASFGREAHIAYLLDHPVIRRVHALCREPGELFMTMEYVDGVSLTTVLKRAYAARRRLPLAGILALLERLCGALHYAHQLVDEHGRPAGFVHRDVSPSNVMVSSTGRVKLIDLGVARTVATGHETNSGLIKGKYGYMAPEILWSSPFDRRADVFSLGVLAWELITRCKLYPVRNPPVDVQQVRARPLEAPSRRDPQCPVALDAVVLRALAADPADRWPTCAAMAEAVRAVARQRGDVLDDAAVAELSGFADDPEDVRRAGVAPLGTPVRSPTPPRTRLARGTPPEVPAARTLPPVPMPVPWAAPPTVATPRPATRHARRWLLHGAIGGSLATLLVAGLAGLAVSRVGRDAAAAAAPVSVPVAVLVPMLVATAVPMPVGVPMPVPVAVDPPAPAAPAPAAPADVPSPLAGALEVAASAVRRLDGPWPRSRSAAYPYRARLCVDRDGAVVTVDIVDGPERLAGRISHALRRWRYRPYHDDTGVHPVCFEIASHVQKMARRG
ncbi:MAG: protein kinase [Kofleriaceae bacterium]|nr:protein kinase [Kofleriaceae bacterium]